MKSYARDRHSFRRMSSGLGRYRNPYGRPVKKKPKTRLILWLLAGGGGAALVIYLLVFSPAFSVLEVTVSGASAGHADVIRDITRRYLDERIYFIVPRRNTFFTAGDALQKKISSALFLDDVRLERNGMHVLKIVVVEKEPGLVVVSAGKAYLADRSGLVLSEMPPAAAGLISRLALTEFLTSTSSIPTTTTSTIYTAPRLPASGATNTERYPVLFVGGESRYSPRQQVNRPETLQTIFKSQETLKEYGIGVLAAAIAADNALEMSVRTNEGWDLYLFSGDKLDSELDILKTALTSTLRDRRELQYVDLRYGNKVFYK